MKFGEWFQTVATSVVNDFYSELARLPRSRRILDMLSADELAHLKSRQTDHLSTLAGAGPTPEAREATARHVGHIHAIVGLDRDELVIGRGLIMTSVHRHMAATGHRDETAVAFAERLTEDLTWQLQAYQVMEDTRQEVLQRITKAVWVPGSYTDLINRVVDILGSHGPVVACAIGRPDEHGVFRFEAAAANGMDSYFSALQEGPLSQIVVGADQPGGQGPVGRAWRDGRSERIINFSTDTQAAPWRAQAPGKGLRSCVAVPLGVPGKQPLAILLFHSGLPGGFIGLQQIAFFDMVQTLLGSAFARLDEVDGIHATIPFAARNRLAALVRAVTCSAARRNCDIESGKRQRDDRVARHGAPINP